MWEYPTWGVLLDSVSPLMHILHQILVLKVRWQLFSSCYFLYFDNAAHHDYLCAICPLSVLFLYLIIIMTLFLWCEASWSLCFILSMYRWDCTLYGHEVFSVISSLSIQLVLCFDESNSPKAANTPGSASEVTSLIDLLCCHSCIIDTALCITCHLWVVIKITCTGAGEPFICHWSIFILMAIQYS